MEELTINEVLFACFVFPATILGALVGFIHTFGRSAPLWMIWLCGFLMGLGCLCIPEGRIFGTIFLSVTLAFAWGFIRKKWKDEKH